MPNNIRFGIPLFVVSFLVFSLAFYGGAKLVEPTAVAPTPTEIPGTPGPTPEPGAPVTVRIAAKNILFDVRTIMVARNAEVTVIFENQDAGVLHNVAFYTDRTTRTRIYVGEIFAGIATREYRFKAPSTPGSYFFRCDVHPDTMTGTFIVQ
jgi:plastocyanin